jgi:hypothetical protein
MLQIRPAGIEHTLCHPQPWLSPHMALSLKIAPDFAHRFFILRGCFSIGLILIMLIFLAYPAIYPYSNPHLCAAQ